MLAVAAANAFANGLLQPARTTGNGAMDGPLMELCDLFGGRGDVSWDAEDATEGDVGLPEGTTSAVGLPEGPTAADAGVGLPEGPTGAHLLTGLVNEHFAAWDLVEESATSAVGPPGGATGAALDLLTGTGAVGPPGGTTGAPLELQAGLAQAPGQAPT